MTNTASNIRGATLRCSRGVRQRATRAFGPGLPPRPVNPGSLTNQRPDPATTRRYGCRLWHFCQDLTR